MSLSGTRCAILLLTICASCHCLAGTIKGKVVDASGKLKGSVVIVYTRTSAATHTKGPQSGAAAVDGDGTFRIDGLGEGVYALCVQGTNHDYLDPCVWSPPPPKVELKSKEDTQAARVDLIEGVRLKLKFRDPKKLMASRANATGKGKLRPGIWQKNGFFVAIPETAQKADSQEYEMLVPADESLHLSFRPESMRVLDANGEGLPLGQVALAVSTSRSEKQKQLEFTAEEELK